MQREPLISVVMPVFNTERYVAEAIESVFAQTYKNVELICIDDCSSDDTLHILNSFGSRIKLLQNTERSGIARTRNRGLQVANGEYIAFIDADDIWKSDKLSRQLDAFTHNSEIGLCFTHMVSFVSPELPDEIARLRFCPPGPMPGYIVGTCLAKRDVFSAIGQFDEALRVGEFIDWHTRAKEAGFQSALLEDVLYQRRIHETNTGISERPARTDYLKVARSALLRRRQK